MALPLPNVPGDGTLAQRYRAVRETSVAMCAPLSQEDMVVQSMPDVSPSRWHLAHVTWFFETFLLKAHLAGYQAYHPQYEVLFNSYYNSIGAQFPREQRGLVTRPGAEEVLAYRRYVDAAMGQLFAGELPAPTRALIEVGLQHEMQHQELLLMDILHVLSKNPLRPKYCAAPLAPAADAGALTFQGFAGGLVQIGHADEGFCFDNERPRHQHWLDAFELGTRLVTNGEYLQFVRDGGYRAPLLWLADGWAQVQGQGWRAPEYWFELDGSWHEFGLHGAALLDPGLPVTHLSYYEADAYATWVKARLPTENEWEHAAAGAQTPGERGSAPRLHPTSASEGSGMRQLYADAWQWTASAYLPYPGFVPAEGALGEYNGKFMINQMVLRGGACVTPHGHSRATYRNFFYPHQRWMFSGLRLARAPS